MMMLSGLAGAFQFLTRVPLRLSAGVPHEKVVPWFPAAGAVIGLVVGGVGALASLVVSPLLAAMVAVTTGLAITGAFHEDGLADIADAFGGGWDVEQRLAILKDSRHGTYAVAAMVSSIGIRVIALGSIDTPVAMLAGAVCAHTLARGAAVVAMMVFPPAVDSGLGASSARNLRPLPTWVGLAAGVAISIGVVGWWTGPALIASAIAVLVVGRLAMAKIGGIAGDVLGAVEQVAECLVLITLAALFS